MRLNLRRTLAVVGLLAGLILSFQNCSKHEFSTVVNAAENVDGTTDTGGPNCRDELTTIVTPIQIILVVDTSGSNATLTGTDPNKTVRAEAMARFYDYYKNKNNFTWNLTVFSGTTARTLLEYGTPSQMPAALLQFGAVKDEGNTPYKTALDEAASLIAGDVSRTPDTKYIVVFLSDGVPNPVISDSNLKAAVDDLVDTSPGQVSLNTVYYGPADVNARERLEDMALEGGGNFLDTNTNRTGNLFSISDLVLIPGTVCN